MEKGKTYQEESCDSTSKELFVVPIDIEYKNYEDTYC